ncbi:hypothetical protein LY90DRAFT_671575 [Neocallimastix californiae]|uniref:SH3 domain-containing protein n=1 Tax=Neocallimastix californiae TaxID=1754190 RepID=A0A1Y2CD84_9FUNG|nr:hypothetical protein LY90DRAFT_671575 [Neocallimastix californiae]|eukprot:ORY45008.1 hypothetical protein LY90DRAFT_671575 [Neocallimastix californiae]
MSSFLTTIFLILNSYIELIQSKPVNKDNNNYKRNENGGNNNNTLKVFLIIVLLFIIGSILYFTKSLWYNCIEKLFVKEKNDPKPSDSDIDITDKTFENIQFDSINFSEIHGNSYLSIDITNIIEKYINTSKDSTSLSSIIELGSISQSSTPRPNSKTFINISNNYSSPNLENYNIFEDELNNLKTQEITDSKIPIETSYIENSPSFLNDESSSISKKILIGINNIEVKPNIKIESLENQNSIEKEKCESVKSKKSIINEKSHKNENQKNGDENESINNTGININDEKTLINKSLKPLSLDGDTSIQENNQKLSNDSNSSNESKENNKEQSSDEIQIITQIENEEPVSSVQDNDLIISSQNHDISVTHSSSLKVENQFNGSEELSISSSEESISNIGAKIDPIDTNDDSMSSLDLEEVNSSQEDEEYIEDINQSSVESLEVLESNNNSQLLSIPVPEKYYEKNQESQSFVIIKDNKPVGGIEVIITPSPDETETEKPSTENIEPITEVKNIKADIENEIKIDETENPSSEIEADAKVDETEKPSSEIEADVKVDETEKPSSEIEVNAKVNETKKPSSEIEVDAKVDETEKPSSEIEVDAKVDETEKPSSEIEVDAKVNETEKPSSEIEVGEIEKSSFEIIKPSTEFENGEVKADTKVDEIESLNKIVHSTEPKIERVDLQNDSDVEPIDKKKLEVDNQKLQMEKIEENIQTIQASLENEITDIKPPLYEINDDAKKSTEENNKDEDETKSVIKLNKRTSSLNLHIKKRRESIGSKANYYSSKKNKQNKAKKIQQSINEEIESIANEIDNDSIKEKFNDYVEKRNSIQSDTSVNSLNKRRSSALSTYILQNENSEISHDDSKSKIEKSKNNIQSSKLALNIDTSVDDIQPFKEDNTPDKQSPSITPSSFTAFQLHNQLRSPTPTGFYNNYSHSISPSLSTASDSDSLRDQCISPTPSEDSTISSGSHSYSIGKISRHKQFEVVYDHKPQLPDEIPLRKGDIVQIKQVFEDGWAYGIVKKKRMDGIFPIQCLGEEIEPSRNGRMVPRLVRVYQARLEDEEQERQEEEEFKKKVTDQARKNLLLKLALSHPK